MIQRLQLGQQFLRTSEILLLDRDILVNREQRLSQHLRISAASLLQIERIPSDELVSLVDDRRLFD